MKVFLENDCRFLKKVYATCCVCLMRISANSSLPENISFNKSQLQWTVATVCRLLNAWLKINYAGRSKYSMDTFFLHGKVKNKTITNASKQLFFFVLLCMHLDTVCTNGRVWFLYNCLLLRFIHKQQTETHDRKSCNDPQDVCLVEP